MTPLRPPALARALLRLLLPGTVRNAFAGDLEERFHRLAEADAVLLATVAVIAAYLPARKASRVDPVRALRTE